MKKAEIIKNLIIILLGMIIISFWTQYVYKEGQESGYKLGYIRGLYDSI